MTRLMGLVRLRRKRAVKKRNDDPGHDLPGKISSGTKDSGIGSSIESKFSATKTFQKSRISRKMTTVHGSLPDISVEEPCLLKQKRDPAFDPDALKLQKQEMKLLGLGSDSREPKVEKIARWLQGVEIDLDEDITGSIFAVGRLMMSYINLGVDIDLGENIPEGIHTAVDKLTMGGFNPLPETLEIFSNCLQDINLQVHELDLSNNVVLREDEINHIAAIVRQANVSSLLLQDCELDFELMLKLQKSIGNTKLTNLDVSKANENKKSPTRLGPDGVAVLGNIVSNCRIQTLALRNCGLRQEDMSKLRQALADAKLFELDVSGNDSLGPGGIAELAGLVHEAEVEKLILRNCGSCSTNLLNLKESIGDAKLTTLDVSENKLETDEMAYLGHIAKHCRVRNLLLRDCSLIPGHMTALKQSLEGYVLMKLDIGKKKAPAQALSILESDSTEASDETGYTEEKDQSESIPESSKEILKSRTAECLRDTKQESLSSLQPEQLIINFLPNVKKHIKMDNWEMSNEGKEVLEDEMRKRMLHDLEISFGSEKKSISSHGCRERAGAVKRWSMVILTAALSLVLLMLLIQTIMHEDAIKNDADPNVHIIGKEGGKISHLGCSIIFPPKAVSKGTRLTLKVERPTNIPAKLLPLTPMISCYTDRKKFARNVTVKLQTWAIARDGSVMAQILRRDPDKDWERFKEVPFTSEVITFEIDHFSSYAAFALEKAKDGISWILNEMALAWQSKLRDRATDHLQERGWVNFRINNHMHRDDNGRIRVTFSVDSELMNQDIRSMEKHNGYKDLLGLPIKMNLDAEGVIEYKFHAKKPEGVSFMTESETKNILKATIPVSSIAKHLRYADDLLLVVHDEIYSGKVTIAYKLTKRHHDNESRLIFLDWPLDGELGKNIASKSTAAIGPEPSEL